MKALPSAAPRASLSLPMKKLTLISVVVNGRCFSIFVNAKYENGKAFVCEHLVNAMLRKLGVTERGVTFCIG